VLFFRIGACGIDPARTNPMFGMKRRRLITLLGGAAGLLVTRPFVAHSQQPTHVARIGYVSGTSSAADPGPFVDALQQGMREHGYVDGKDFIIEYRGAEGRLARVPELVAELVQAKVDVLVTPFPTAIRAAKQATDTIPIVMVTSIDPVAAGIIDSLAKPGGNITGLSVLTQNLSAKRLEFLKDVVPKLARVGILVDAGDPVAAAGYRDYEAPAQALQMELRSLEVRGPNPDLDAAIKAALEWRAEALIIVTTLLLFPYRKAIADLALKWRLPTAYHGSDWVVAGGLMSYSADELAVFRRAAYYIDRILKGAKPRDLPVEQPTKFRLAINQRTARALGLFIPLELLAFADEVID
jgi:putative tryptophan/tyrosine transport system substrate-binding protein